MADYIYIIDPATGEESRVSYDDLDTDVYPQIFKPIGGFCYPADTFTHLALPKAPFYLSGWLPKQGKAMLYSPAKSGKSFLSYQIARCIAQGEEFLGIPTAKGRVLILQFELGEQVVQDRLLRTKQNYDGVYIGTSFAMKLDTSDGKKQFTRAVEAVKPNVVILDPFYKIIKGDENEAHDVSAITDFLDSQIEMFRDLQLSVFIMHHPGKDISKGGRGSSVLEGWVDSYLEMKRVTFKDDRTLHVKITPKLLRHAELPDQPIEAVMQNYVFTVTTPIPTIRDKVLAVFQATPTNIITIKNLMDTELGSRKSICNAMESLVDEGIVTKVGYGQYMLAQVTTLADLSALIGRDLDRTREEVEGR